MAHNPSTSTASTYVTPRGSAVDPPRVPPPPGAPAALGRPAWVRLGMPPRASPPLHSACELLTSLKLELRLMNPWPKQADPPSVERDRTQALVAQWVTAHNEAGLRT